MKANFTKRVLGFILAMVMIVGLVPTISLPTVGAADYNGFIVDPTQGTIPADAIHIKTAAELAAIGGGQSGGKYYVLDNDINLTAEWVPIHDFRGTFDGQGYSINNLYVLESSQRRLAGLFGALGRVGEVIADDGYIITIKNVGVNIGTQGINASENGYAGGLCATFSAYHLLGSSTIFRALTIQNCYVTGNVTVSGYSWAGGLIGDCRGSTNSSYKTTIENCYATGDVTASGAGGLIGFCSYILIKNCYATGDVTASGTAGGLIGFWSHDVDRPIENCYATGDVTASDNAGSLIGDGRDMYDGSDSENLSRLNSCYTYEAQKIQRFDSNGNYIGAKTNDLGKPLTSAQMKDKSSFIGWDFVNVWDIDPSVNNGYPFLKGSSPGNGGSTPAPNNKDIPIIIIPGMIESRLFSSKDPFDASTKVWDPDFWSILGGFVTLNSLGSTLKNDNLYVRPPEDQRTATEREYGALSVFEELVETLISEFPNRAIYLFSYDWRKDNRITANNLEIFIDSLGVEKVDLICHSMGGLVASYYYKQNQDDHKINKIITAGTPYEGAPKLLNAVQTKEVTDEWYNNLGLSTLGMFSSDVKSSFVSIAELAPTRNYIDKIPMWKRPFGGSSYQLTYAEYENYLKIIFGSYNTTATTTFHNTLHGSNGYNALLEFPNAYFSIGINQPTVTAIKFYSGEDYKTGTIVLYEEDLKYNMKGDGTVPYLSASMIEEVIKLDPSSFRYNVFSTDHTGTVGHHNKKNPSLNSQADKSLKWIVDVLKGENQYYNDEFISHANGYAMISDNDKSCIVVKVACPVDVSISKNGELLSSNPNTYSSLSSFGRMDVLGLNSEIKMFCLEVDDYDISITGTDDGSMDYTIRWFDGNDNLIDERYVTDVAISKATKIGTGTNKNQPTVLNIDGNGDGTVDRTVPLTKAENPDTNPNNPDNDNNTNNGNTNNSGSNNSGNNGNTPNPDNPGGASSSNTNSNNGNNENPAGSNNTNNNNNSNKDKPVTTDPGKTNTAKEETDSAEDNQPDFKIKANAQKIKYMAAYADNTFKPDQYATRYEILEALNELLDIEKTPTAITFSDVPGDKSELIGLFAGAGIVDGYPDGTFKGENGITRAEFIKLISISFKLEINPESVQHFTDVADHWALEYITAFASHGYILGYPDGTFRPDRQISRAEVVAIINRILGIVSEPGAESRFDDLGSGHWAYGDIMAAAK